MIISQIQISTNLDDILFYLFAASLSRLVDLHLLMITRFYESHTATSE